MRTFILTIILFSLSSFVKAQTIDRAPNGFGNYRAVEGGSEKVQIDTITPLNLLIKKLQSNWKLLETGKAYWIGYTDNMYSIAHYKDKAIVPLINFIDTTKTLKAKKGALFTLHLIGINCSVIGRFVEDFENKKARAALLRYLDDSALNETVMYLIMRDTWLSDIPKLMQYLSNPGKDYSKVLSALRRYNFENKPFDQKIIDTLFKRNISISTPGSEGMQPMYALITFQTKFTPYFIVDKEITESAEWKKSLEELSVKTLTAQTFSVYFFLNIDSIFSFCDFDDSYNYTIYDHKIEVYGPIKARKIWLDWWKQLSQQEKERLFVSNHVPFNPNNN